MKVLLALMFILMYAECQRHRHQKCKDPTEESLRNKLLRLTPDSLLLGEPEHVPDITMKRCPLSINTSSELIQDRSISPWSYRINEDLNRYPQMIVEAYCLCKGCVSSKSNHMVSEHFFKEVPVLYKSSKCKKSRYIYKLRYIPIAQFCVCRFR
ncbi:interleukin-17D-like [Hyperolius riggenbachi]|uniref:interleukin-17D-like n=1 Tax=Hyperolius riggenbachi TaxID=752182 RepID=UPI0035A268A4